MANDMKVAVVLSMKDQLSAGLMRARASVSRFAGSVGAATAPFGRLTNVISGIAGVAAKAFSSIIGGLGTIGQAALRAAGRLANIGKWAALIGGTSLVLISKASIEAAMQMEGYFAKLTVALKDASKAKDMLGWAKTFSQTTPFEMQAVVDATVRLEMYGLSAKKWMPLVGDMAGAMGKNVTDAVEAIADAVSGGGLERLKEFGISTPKLLAAGAGGAGGGGAGAIDYQSAEGLERIKSALQAIMTRDYGGGMSKMMKTSAGALSNFKDAVFGVKVAIGEAMVPALKDALAYGQKFVTWLKESGTAQRFGEALGKAAAAILALAQQALPVLVAWLSRLNGKDLWAWAQNMAGSIGGWLKALAGWVKENMQTAGEWLKYLVDMGKFMVAWFYKHIPDMAALVTRAFAVIGDAVLGAAQAWNSIKTTAVAAFDAILAGLAFFVAATERGLQVWLNILAGLVSALNKIPGINLDDAEASIKRAHTSMKAAVGDTTQFMKDKWAEAGKVMDEGVQKSLEYDKQRANFRDTAATTEEWAGRVKMQWSGVPEPVAPAAPSSRFTAPPSPGTVQRYEFTFSGKDVDGAKIAQDSNVLRAIKQAIAEREMQVRYAN